jgi:hypothetical protein
LPLELDAGGRIETYASKHAVQILHAPRGAGYWALLGVGVLSTLVLSLVPSFGLLTVLVLPLIQVFCLERSIQRFQQHFGFLHGLTVDFYSGLILMVLVMGQSIANLTLQFFAPLISVPLFLGVWWTYERYGAMHFRQVASHQRPANVELTLIGGLAGLIVLMPTALLVAVLVSYLHK